MPKLDVQIEAPTHDVPYLVCGDCNLHLHGEDTITLMQEHFFGSLCHNRWEFCIYSVEDLVAFNPDVDRG